LHTAPVKFPVADVPLVYVVPRLSRASVHLAICGDVEGNFRELPVPDDSLPQRHVGGFVALDRILMSRVESNTLAVRIDEIAVIEQDNRAAREVIDIFIA